MNIEYQVCSLDQAKNFKELLGETYGLFVYMENKTLPSDSKIMLSTHTESFKQMGKIEGSTWIKYYPAFTVAELGVMLIDVSEKIIATSFYNPHFGEWECHITKESEEGEHEPFVDANGEGDNEAECRAESLIWLLENKYFTPANYNNIEHLKVGTPSLQSKTKP